MGIQSEITDETRPFWDAAAEGRLVVEQCAACGKYVFPPRGVCSHCYSRHVQPAEVIGIGRVYSYTVSHQRWLADVEAPYALVLVEFDDYPDVRIFGRLRGCPTEEVQVGMEVGIGFEPGAAGLAIPSFVRGG